MKETIQNLEALLNKIESALKVIGLDEKKQRAAQLNKQMQAPDFWQDQKNARLISQQAAALQQNIEQWESLRKKVSDALEIARSDEKALDVNLRSEIDQSYYKFSKEYEKLENSLLLSGPHDEKNAILSIHAGAGGDDAQDWSEILSRMYLRYAEIQSWEAIIIDSTKGSQVGIKSITLKISGHNAYGLLKSEHGVHRLVRLSPFDADHARHTSFALVEVLPELADAEIDIDEKDLRIDTFMSSGHGGQSVNTTYSAVRIVHEPTGIIVSCQNERSQSQNKAMALKILQARLQQMAQQEKVREIKDIKGRHKEAAWGNQIRSYVLHPYKMVKDLRTEYEESDPEKVLDGQLSEFIDHYLRWQANRET